MITATTWVRRGVAAPFPEKYQIDEEEMKRISQLAKFELEDAKVNLAAAQDHNKKDRLKEEAEDSAEASISRKEKQSAKKFVQLFHVYSSLFSPRNDPLTSGLIATVMATVIATMT
jgi:hypothetical protein